jgi:protein SCO1
LLPNGNWRRTAIASLVVGAAGAAVFWHGTDGLRAITSEQARRLTIARHPRDVPSVVLEDQDGQTFTLGAYQGRSVAVDFIYTQCKSVCALLSAGLQRLDRAEHSRAGDDRLQLVSISFDPARDTPARLSEYASRYGADGRGWRFARVRDAEDLARLLDAFGIVVIPDGTGDFQHNAAIHLLNRDGRLARVLDVDTPPDAIARALASSR